MQIFLNNSILPSVFFDVRVPEHACMMTGEMQISLGLTRFQFAFALLLLSSHTRLGLTRFQFAFALLLLSAHTRLGLRDRNCFRSQIEQINQRISFSQKLSTIIHNSSATVGDGKVMLM